MATAHDVAAYVLERSGPITSMKLQKLCYYSQAYHLAWLHRPLFSDPIEAWTNGPVIRNLWNAHRGQYIVHAIPGGEIARVGSDERRVIDSVLAAFGGLTGKQLSDRTHSEAPWLKYYDGDDARPNEVISHQDLESFYSNPTAMTHSS